MSRTFLTRVIGAIGDADFAMCAAAAVREFLDFERSAVVLHRRDGNGPHLVFDDFEARYRAGIANYLDHTHRMNPMLARLPAGGVRRAADFAMSARELDRVDCAYVVPSDREELGFRTLGWPDDMEEIDLYFAAGGGVVELGVYRERRRDRVSAERLRELDAATGLLAAAFDRNWMLAPSPATESPLSPREREIRDLLLTGCSSEAIALRLGISRHTVKDHRKRIFRKLGIASLAELFALDRRPH